MSLLDDINEAEWGVVHANGIGDCWYETVAMQEIFYHLKDDDDQGHSPLVLPHPGPIPSSINSRLTVSQVYHWGAKCNKNDPVVAARTKGLRKEIKAFLLNPGSMALVPRFPLNEGIFPTLGDLISESLDDIDQSDRAWALAQSTRQFPIAYAFLVGKNLFWATLVEIVSYTMIYADTQIQCLRVEENLPALAENVVGLMDSDRVFIQLVQVGTSKKARKAHSPLKPPRSPSKTKSPTKLKAPLVLKPKLMVACKPSDVKLETPFDLIGSRFNNMLKAAPPPSNAHLLKITSPQVSAKPASPKRARTKKTSSKNIFLDRMGHYSPLFKLEDLQSLDIDFTPLPQYRSEEGY